MALSLDCEAVTLELHVGDVVERHYKNGRVGQWRVVGFTARGKTRLLNLATGNEMTAWWRYWLPKGYYLRSDE